MWESGCEDGESFPPDLSVHCKRSDGIPGNHVIRQESETSGLLGLLLSLLLVEFPVVKK